MGLADVDRQELRAVMVFGIQFVETDRPLDVRRSGEAAENQGDGFLAPEIGKPNGILAVHIAQLKIGGHVSSFGRRGIMLSLPRFMVPVHAQEFSHRIPH